MGSRNKPRSPSAPSPADIPSPSPQQPDAGTLLPVVGIGASAGGLHAFIELLSRLPSDTGMAFVLVQHLDPVHPSQLAELLAKATPLPVVEAADGMAVMPDHVYVIPPNFNLAIAQGALCLSPRAEARLPNLPLDFLFRSLAKGQQGRAIGVVLSGTGSDGSAGLEEIKAAGGITFAQDEESAEYPGMPHSAIASGCVDFVLPPRQIAAELASIARHPYLRPTPQPPTAADDNGDYAKVVARLHSATGVDFTDYRDTTIKRRIARRMALHRQDSLGGYARLLADDAPEVQALYRDILINVTGFFRDPEVFEALKTQVFPQIIKGKSAEKAVRIWVAGCSTGQEAYSLAMCLLEFLDQQPTWPAIQIFGTDINDAAAIEKARPGLYPASIEAEVSPERLARFFTKEDGGWRISKTIRDMCVFARHDLAADPPFSHLDLVSCRNVLIYLSPALQQRVIPTFHYALNPGGFLALGPSESVGRFADLFEPLDRKHNLYARLSTLSPVFPYHLPTGRPPAPADLPPAAREHIPAAKDMRREADRIIMGRFAPAAVLVDENLEILQYRGSTAPYLQQPAGPPTQQLLKMLRDTLFLEVRSAVEEARKQDAIVRREAVRMDQDGAPHPLTVEVSPVRLPGSERRCFLLLFMEAVSPAPAEAPATESPAPGSAPAGGEEARENQRLRQDLASAKEYLQAIIEQQSAANEEMQSANEETRSANEELQSTNEELQTAKEELQSTNEELRTLNDELLSRSESSTRISDDLTNTLSSIGLPLVILGPDLRIRRFTPAAGALLNLIASDVGRPLADIQPRFDIPGLSAMLLDVVATVAVRREDVRTRDGRWYAMEMHPYRTVDRRIDGVVLLWHDIDERRRSDQDVRQARDVAEAAGRTKDRFLAVLSHELRTPLTPVLAAAGMMRDDASLPADARENLAMIHRNVEMEAALIDDLLDTTRVASGKLVLHVRTVNLPELLRHAAETLAAEVQIKGQRLSLDLDQGPRYVRGDSGRLQQVFLNLLRNAIKFTPDGGRIAIRTFGTPDGASRTTADACSTLAAAGGCPEMAGADLTVGSAVVEVSDNGMGIAPEMIEHMFDPFEQGERTVTRRYGGLGLGLAICRSLTEMHGGKITAASPGPGLGATFRVELPLCSPELEPCDREAGRAAASGESPAAKVGKLQLLLVEDHADTARILARLLEQSGHVVQVAQSVAAGLRLAEAHPFDVVISDLGLPDGSGHDLMRQIRAAGHKAKGIAVSGYGMEEDVRASHAAGFAEHITKPVDLERLEAAIGRVARG